MRRFSQRGADTTQPGPIVGFERCEAAPMARSPLTELPRDSRWRDHDSRGRVHATACAGSSQQAATSRELVMVRALEADVTSRRRARRPLAVQVIPDRVALGVDHVRGNSQRVVRAIDRVKPALRTARRARTRSCAALGEFRTPPTEVRAPFIESSNCHVRRRSPDVRGRDATLLGSLRNVRSRLRVAWGETRHARRRLRQVSGRASSLMLALSHRRREQPTASGVTGDVSRSTRDDEPRALREVRAN